MQLLLFIAALVLFYFLIKPLLIIFLSSVILTYVFYPLYKRIKKALKYENLSISLTLVLIVIIFLIPFVSLASQVPKQASYIYSSAKTNIIGNDFFNLDCENVNSAKCNIVNFLTGTGYINFDEIIDFIFKKIIEIATRIVISVPNIIVAIVLSLFISFFLFKDGIKLLNRITSIIPISKSQSKKLVEQFGRVTYSVVFAHIIVAITQGALGAIGFYIFGVKSAIFWGIVMAFFSLIPLIGPAVIWIPASVILFIKGLMLNSYWEIGMGVGLLLYGILIISTSDNIIRLKMIGDTTDVHPITVLIGIIGGINLFGLIGIFIGPIALSLLITFFKEFRREYT